MSIRPRRTELLLRQSTLRQPAQSKADGEKKQRKTMRKCSQQSPPSVNGWVTNPFYASQILVLIHDAALIASRLGRERTDAVDGRELNAPVGRHLAGRSARSATSVAQKLLKGRFRIPGAA